MAILLWRPHHILLHRSATFLPQQGNVVFLFSQHVTPVYRMRVYMEQMACSSLLVCCHQLMFYRHYVHLTPTGNKWTHHLLVVSSCETPFLHLQ